MRPDRRSPRRRATRTLAAMARSLTPLHDTMQTLLASGQRSFSFEFFPPKDDAAEAVLWDAIRRLEPLRPTYVSVTYGAGGSTRERTTRIVEQIAEHTTLTPVAHLTCVGSSVAELRRVVARLRRRRHPERARPARRPAGRPVGPLGAAPRGPQLRDRPRAAGPQPGLVLHRRGRVPGRAPGQRGPRGRRPRAGDEGRTPARSSPSRSSSSGPSRTSGWSSGPAPTAATSRSFRGSCR